MSNPSDTMLRNILGPSLQTASLRAILLVAALAFIGSGCTYLFH